MERRILQPVLPAVRAFSSIRRARTKTWQWFGVYFFAAVIVLEALLALGMVFLPGLAEFALGYVFPEAWGPFIQALGERLFSEQMSGILASTGMALGVFAVGIFLFPVKEKLSAQFERDAYPDLERGREPSLFRQGIEELQLLAFYAVFQSLSLYLGLQGQRSLAVAGTILAYWYLVLAMALDHAAPFFQRRRFSLFRIVYLLFRGVPFSLHAIGAVCILPAILLQLWAPLALPAAYAITAVVLAEVLGMAVATLSGCALGAEMMRDKTVETRVPKFWAWGAPALCVLILIWQGIFFAWWGLAARGLSPLLKCQYHLDWRRAEIEHRGRPSPTGRIAVITLAAPVLVTNPTRRQVALKDARIEFRRDGDLLGSGYFSTLAVAPQTSAEVDFQVTFEVPIESAAADFFQARTWRELQAAILVYPPLSTPVTVWEWKGLGESSQ